MWDLVGNPEDRFSHNEAHMQNCVITDCAHIEEVEMSAEEIRCVFDDI